MRRVPLALALAVPVGATALALAPVAGAATWGAPVRISQPDRASYSSGAVAAGPAGAAVAAWLRTPAGAPRGAGRVQLASRPSGRGWARARTISGPGASLPRTALNARGDAAAAWLNGRLIVAAVRRGPHGAFTPGRVGEAGAPVQDLTLAIDRGGRPTAAWIERRGDGFQVRLATAGPGGARWQVRSAGVMTPGPEPPSLSLSPGRGALAAWVDDGRVMASRTVDGDFERPVPMSDPDSSSPGASLGPSGAALVAWSARLPGGTRVLQAAGRPEDAPRWGSADDVGIGGAAVVGVNDAGDAVIAWGTGQAGGEQSVETGMSRRGGDWRASTIVAPRSCDCELSAVAAAVDGRGRAAVAWRRDDGTEGDAGGAATLAPGGDTWDKARIPPTRVAGSPAVAAAQTAGIVAVWAAAGAGGGVRAVEAG